MELVKKTLKNVLSTGRSYNFHYKQNKEAKRMLSLIEKERGKLSKKNHELCLEYALDVFKSKIYSPWLMTYCAWNNEFKEGWIPDNYYGEYVVPELKGHYGQICNRNAFITKLLEDENSSDLCYYVNRLFVDTSFNKINESDLKSFLFNENDKIVFKIENSLQGKGVYFFTEDDFDLRKVKQLGNGVFQKFIKQHKFFNNFGNKAVSTIRLTSVSTDYGEFQVRAGYLRFASKDDTHVISARQMRIPINTESGKLYELAFHPKSESTKNLPGLNFEFANKELPNFEHCKQEIQKFHSKIPFIRCIGWDLIIDDQNEVQIIELNGGHNAITFSEIIYGPCFTGLNWEGLQHK